MRIQATLLAAPLLGWAMTSPLAAQVGEPFCPGDGCPCGNEDAAAGCGNDGIDGDTATGALLSASGSAVVQDDDLVLHVSGVAPGAPILLFMGAAVPSFPAGDGLVCVGAGPGGVFRLAPGFADAAGELTRTAVVAESQGFMMGGTIEVGSTWAFQGLYRDTGGPCGSLFNYTNGLRVTFQADRLSSPIPAELAGRPLSEYPWFERVDTINQGDNLEISFEGTPYEDSAGVEVDVWVVPARSAEEWALGAPLVDARGASQSVTIPGAGAQSNIVILDAGTLDGTVGDHLGAAFDIVVDGDRDGFAGPLDLVDGFSNDPAVVVARDTTLPGPHAVSTFDFFGGSFRNQRIYYPTDVASMGELPLLVVSHGNGHNYRWYDYIGDHIASYGYVVMSHQNNTMPGIETASTTTLLNTDVFLENLDTANGGLLDGHVDARRIAWMGHSRGGEGIVRAYQRLVTGDYVPNEYVPSDIRLLSSMAPTVFEPLAESTPRGVPYHLWVGSADDDVNGGTANPRIVRSYVLHERALGTRMATVLQGAGHAVFHDDEGGGRVADGPCQITYDEAHTIVRSHMVALLAHFLREEPGARDFLTRPYDSLAPIGSPTGPCIVVSHEYRDGPIAGNAILDDFQTEVDVQISSSGEAVRGDVLLLTEGRMGDTDSVMTDTAADRFNGMTRVRGNLDVERGVTFDWDAAAFLEFDVPAGAQDATGFDSLSFRACQRTRVAQTIMALEDLTFSVTLRDDLGAESTLPLTAFTGGIVEPYQRTGQGAGAGWSNEFETVRLRLADFTADDAPLRLDRIRTVRFEFGQPGMSPVGAIGLDDLQFTRR